MKKNNDNRRIILLNLNNYKTVSGAEEAIILNVSDTATLDEIKLTKGDYFMWIPDESFNNFFKYKTPLKLNTIEKKIYDEFNKTFFKNAVAEQDYIKQKVIDELKEPYLLYLNEELVPIILTDSEKEICKTEGIKPSAMAKSIVRHANSSGYSAVVDKL